MGDVNNQSAAALRGGLRRLPRHVDTRSVTSCVSFTPDKHTHTEASPPSARGHEHSDGPSH